jgi:hypothetical protein
MTGDINIREQVVILPETRALAAPLVSTGKRRVIHQYGSRVVVMEDADDIETQTAIARSIQTTAEVLNGLSQEEQLGYAAYTLRESGDYQSAKAARPRDGES